MIGPTLKALRLKKRLTLKQLAAQMGVSSTFIHYMERGAATPSEVRLSQLATALDADAEHLSLIAGRVPADVIVALCNKPSLLASIRRSAQ